jgi:dienelactone hydrolase
VDPPQQLRNLYLVDAFGHDQDVLKEASPVHHARSNAPPFILFNAAMDFGLEDDALLLRAKLTKAGNSVAHRSFPGTNHGSIIGLGPAWGRPYEPLVRETCAWLKKQIATIQQRQHYSHSVTADEHAEEEDLDRSATRDLLHDALTSMTEESADEACTDNKPVMVLRAYGWE